MDRRIEANRARAVSQPTLTAETDLTGNGHDPVLAGPGGHDSFRETSTALPYRRPRVPQARPEMAGAVGRSASSAERAAKPLRMEVLFVRRLGVEPSSPKLELAGGSPGSSAARGARAPSWTSAYRRLYLEVRTQRTLPRAARLGPGISSFRILAPRWSSAYKTVAIEASGVLPLGTMSPRATARSVSSPVPRGRLSARRTLKAASRYVTCRTVPITWAPRPSLPACSE